MSTIEQQAKGKKDGEIRYLTPLNIETNKTKKYCRFKKSGIKYVDYKDADWLLGFVNEQGKIYDAAYAGLMGAGYHNAKHVDRNCLCDSPCPINSNILIRVESRN